MRERFSRATRAPQRRAPGAPPMKRVLGVAILAVVAAQPMLAQQRDRLTVADYLNYEQVSDPQISPDGRTVVYARQWVDQINDRWESAIWVMDANGARQRFLVKGGSPRWSPDGTRLAYIAMGEEPKGPQIFVRWMDAEGAVTQVTRVTDAPSALRWSPDGRWIGFVQQGSKPNSWAIDLPAAPPNAKWTPAPRIIDQLHYRTDRAGFVDPGFNRLVVVPADGGSPRTVAGGDWRLGTYFDGIPLGVNWQWSPDGRTIYADGLKESDGDLVYRDANIYAIDVATGGVRRLTPTAGTWAHPLVSPDGRQVAYVGHAQTRQTYQVYDLWVMNADGSSPRNLSRELDRDAAFFGFGDLLWAPDGSGIYFSPEDRGARNVLFAPAAGGPVRSVTTGNHVLTASSMAANGTMVGVRSSFDAPGDVVFVTRDRRGNATVTQLTAVNEDLLAGKRLATAEEIWVPSTGGARVQGWIVKPPGFDPGRKYPMLLEIHGGPHGMYSVAFDMMWQTWAANGYVVLYTNPRGSTGYGMEFGNAIDLAYPGVDYDDLMASVDTVLGRGYVDERQLYISGCSGGGKLTSWVIGHTTRFAGAAVRCPVINWMTMAGNSDVPLFSHNFFAKPFWEDPTAWLKQSSLMYVGNVTTPTLLMTGVLDLRTPMAQTEEYYAALKMRGVPTTMLRFEGEWHGTESMPSNWMRTQLYMMSWFQRYGAKPVS